MYRKDYLVKQLEEFGKVLAALLTFKTRNDWAEFEKEIQQAVLKFTSLEIEAIERLDRKTFDDNILNHPALTSDQKKILAHLLFEKMNYFAEKGLENDYQRLREHCLALYHHIKDNFSQNEYDLDVHYKLELLKKM